MCAGGSQFKLSRYELINNSNQQILSNNTVDHECNPSLIDIGAGNSTHYQPTSIPLPTNSLISLIIWFCCLLYASIRTTSYTALGKIGGTTGESNAEGQDIPLSKFLACISLKTLIAKI